MFRKHVGGGGGSGKHGGAQKMSMLSQAKNASNQHC